MKTFFSLCLIAICCGCSGGGLDDAPERYNIKGTATFAGKPIPHGTISFTPVKGNNGPAGSATIVNGEYDTSQNGMGIVGGSHNIVINGFDGNSKPEEELPFGEPLFYEFTKSYDFPAENDGKEPLPINLEVPESAKNPPSKKPRQTV